MRCEQYLWRIRVPWISFGLSFSKTRKPVAYVDYRGNYFLSDLPENPIQSLTLSYIHTDKQCHWGAIPEENRSWAWLTIDCKACEIRMNKFPTES